MHWDYEVDVAIAGAGACGTMSALRALHAGAPSVAIFEKSVRQGCNTQFSSGSLAAGGTRYQRAAGVVDSPERHAEDIMAVSGDRCNEEVVRAVCRAAPRYLEWLADELDYPVELGLDMSRAGQSVARLHTDVGRHGGATLTHVLRRAVTEAPNAALVDESPGVGLVQADDGSVLGLRVSEAGGERTVRARNVVLACDGFAANEDLMATWCPSAAGRYYGGVSTSTGDAIRWGLEAGAAFAHMGAFLGQGLTVIKTGTRLNPVLPFLGSLLVDGTGARFVNEWEQGYSKLGEIIAERANGLALCIWDEEAMLTAEHSELMRESGAAGAYRRYEDLGSLALDARIDPASLVRTLDPRRAHDLLHAPRRELRAPFYAAWVGPAVLTTQGGLRVDAKGRVLREDGSSITGLYAGGGSAAGLSGETSLGYSSGNGLLSALGLGWIIGAEVGDLKGSDATSKSR